MNPLRSLLSLLCMPIIVALLCSCERNSTFRETITFKGTVQHGHKDPSSSMLVIDGPERDATVTCANSGESARSDNSGNYVLSVSGVRTFTSCDSETYILMAHSGNGASEKICIQAKPGVTVDVRSFVLYRHAEEQ